jgi:hypothetical protein
MLTLVAGHRDEHALGVGGRDRRGKANACCVTWFTVPAVSGNWWLAGGCTGGL